MVNQSALVRVVLSGVFSVVFSAGLAACSVSAGPSTPDSEFFPKPTQPAPKPVPAPGEPAEVQLSADLSDTLWSGFGVREASSIYREGHVQVSCTKNPGLSCYGSYVEDNYLGYISGSLIEPLIPKWIKPNAAGTTYQGTLNVACTRRQSNSPVCVHKTR